MPNAFTDRKLASEAGKKSKRSPNKFSPILVKYMTGDGSNKVQKELLTLDGKEFIDAYTKLAPYFYPKLQSLDVNATGDLVVQQITGVKIVKDAADPKVTGQTD